MKPITFILLCLATLLLSAGRLQARFGETLEQCTARYGAGTVLPSGGTLFKKNDVQIEVRFTEDRADWISYTREKPFSKVQIQFLLGLCLPEAQWRAGNQLVYVPAESGGQVMTTVPSNYESVDGLLVAEVLKFPDPGTKVVIQTKARKDQTEAREASAQRQAVEADQAAQRKELEGL